MSALGWFLVLAPVALTAYAYLLYPGMLAVLARGRHAARPAPPEWPTVSISVPVYNEEAQIRGLLGSLLALDYPRDRLQILIISDASSDRTDEIVRTYADRGIELFRMPERRGKTAGENAGAALLRGDIIVNTDASIRIYPHSLKPLIARFADPGVGVASGRDVSVAGRAADANTAEGGYVGYEMWVRRLETQCGGIIGASGCFYAIRAELHRAPLRDSLSRDFASALIAREHGYRAVSVDEAVCLVPRTGSLAQEYRRKVRTITRGMETLAEKAGLLDPLRYPGFAFKLWSHKVARWLVPWSALGAIPGLAILAVETEWARWLLLAGALGTLLLAGALVMPAPAMVRRFATAAAFAVAGNFAAVHAGVRALGGDRNPQWEPTRRHAIEEENVEAA